MTSPLINYKEGINYWDVDTQLTTIEPFKSLYKKDSSKKKDHSSQMMWAVAFYIDPQSKLVNYASAEKQIVISNDIVTIKIDWDKLSVYIEAYANLYLTQIQRSLANWKYKLEERDKYLIGLPYSELGLDEASKLDKLLSDTPKLFEQYFKMEEALKEEISKGLNKGGRKESLSEQKLI
jgi:hypothetical protein